MKKITLLLAAFVLCVTASAQLETYVTETGGVNDPVVYIDAGYPEGSPCGINNPSNAFENGKSCAWSISRIVANDIVVPGGESLVLENMLVNIFMGAQGSGVTASFVDVYYYASNNGEPGAMIGSELGLVPTFQTVVGGNYGFDVWQLELDVADPVFHSQGGSDKTYWIGLSVEATDGSNVFWENSTLGITGYGEAYNNGTGYVVDSALEGVYFITADCFQRLGVEDNFADQVQIYPNPISDGILSMTTPFDSEKQVVIYDVLGKRVIDAQIEGDQLNVSSLQSGVYMLQVTQEGATATKKIVVQ